MNDATNSQVIDEIKKNLADIKQNVIQNPKNLEPVITELTSILNKFDTDTSNDNSGKRPLFQIDIDSVEWIQKIRDISGISDLKIRQIRYKSEELSKKLSIPLPNSTKNHQEPLLYWYQINWEILEPHLKNWNTENDIQNS